MRTTYVLCLHSLAVLHGLSAVLAWKLTRYLGASTLTSANFAQASQKAPGDNLNSRITLLRVVSKKANKKLGIFPDHRAFWNFWGSLWTSIKCDLFNVWICQRRGSQIKLGQCWNDLLPTPLQFNHISLNTSVDNYWIRHSKRWQKNRNKANKDHLSFF